MRRAKIILVLFLIFIFAVIGKLFYWQIINAESLKVEAQNQYWFGKELPAPRGKICTSDKFCLVNNETFYLLFAFRPQLKNTSKEIAVKLAPFLLMEEKKEPVASPSGQLNSPSSELKNLADAIENDLSVTNKDWIPLKHNISRQTKEAIENLRIEGLNFENEERRFYPEASMAAQLLGFLGSDINGRRQGYFGLEGFYNGQLKGSPGKLKEEKDPAGRPILIGNYQVLNPQPGNDLILNIDRTIQFMAEKKLEEGVRKYGAKKGSVIIMDPASGAVLTMASTPKYNPGFFEDFDKELYKNPLVADTYEPGSTFKALVMAAAINEKMVTPSTICAKCAAPRRIGEYTIRTWNDKYYANSTMTEVLQHSDNVGMTFIADRLGLDKFYQYLDAFGFGRPTGIDLQEESAAILRPKRDWHPIDLATASFGQGIAVTGTQMIRAIATIANNGKLMAPQVVKNIKDGEKTIEIKPKMEKEVIKPETARIVTEMMVNAVDKGEAKWAKPKGFKIAGKTGTAQIPIAGHYDPKKTIVSFVGFAPADNPRFVMLVVLQEPSSSQWGSETAAPLWFNISRDLFAYWGILPQE